MRKFAIALAAVAGLGLASIASADSVKDVSTTAGNLGASGWQVSYVPGSTSPQAAFSQAAVAISNPNSGWTGGAALIAAGAEWIGATADGGTTGYFGDYTYSLQFDLDSLPAGKNYVLSGSFSSDNFVSAITLDGVAATITGANDAAGKIYNYRVALDMGGQTSSGNPHTLLVTVHNESTLDGGVSDPTGSTNPTGLILSGAVAQADAAIVPTPAAVWGGLALLGAAGAARARKARREA